MCEVSLLVFVQTSSFRCNVSGGFCYGVWFGVVALLDVFVLEAIEDGCFGCVCLI